jgi:hypothetical protein
VAASALVNDGIITIIVTAHTAITITTIAEIIITIAP